MKATITKSGNYYNRGRTPGWSISLWDAEVLSLQAGDMQEFNLKFKRKILIGKVGCSTVSGVWVSQGLRNHEPLREALQPLGFYHGQQLEWFYDCESKTIIFKTSVVK